LPIEKTIKRLTARYGRLHTASKPGRRDMGSIARCRRSAMTG
jgi:hypothetical protein